MHVILDVGYEKKIAFEAEIINGDIVTVNGMRVKKLLKYEKDVKRLGISVKYICLSLMCEHHKLLHGELFEFSKIMEIYNLENVPEDCRCGITQILLDEEGMPRTPGLVSKIKSQAKIRNL